MRQIIGLTMAVFILVALEVGLAARPQDQEKSNAPQTITRTVSAVMNQLTRSVPPPKTANQDAIAAQVEIRFPRFSSSVGPDAAVEKINQTISSRLQTLLEGQPTFTVEQLVDSFVQKYEKAVQEHPELPGAWSFTFAATIRHADEDLLGLEILDSIFTGGAHPTSHIAYLVFSLKTGEPLDFSTFVPEGKMSELTRVAEEQFRKVRNLKPGETYEQAGFQFDQNRFTLNRNFLVSQAGLAFCFNPYEIAPYALGVTELVIPWNQLTGVIDANGPAGRFLKEQP